MELLRTLENGDTWLLSKEETVDKPHVGKREGGSYKS